MKTWIVTGDKRGKPVTVTLQAEDHNAAVRAASTRRGLLLVVTSCRIVDPSHP